MRAFKIPELLRVDNAPATRARCRVFKPLHVWERHHPTAKAIAPRIPRELLGLRVGLLVADVRQVFGVCRMTAWLAVKFARAA